MRVDCQSKQVTYTRHGIYTFRNDRAGQTPKDTCRNTMNQIDHRVLGNMNIEDFFLG